MPKPVQSVLAGRILGRVFHLGKGWPFKDKQFARIIQEAAPGDIEMLAYCAVGASDEEFTAKLNKLIQADNARHAPVCPPE